MKKTTILSWLIVCALLLVGCNSQYSPASTETSPTEPLPTGSATGDAEPFIPSFMQGTQKPTETTPPQPQPEITWDQTKYDVIIGDWDQGDIDGIDSYPCICQDESHTQSPLPEGLSSVEVVEFLGNSYSGVYRRTLCTYFCNYKKYEYESGDCSFLLDENGILTGFHSRVKDVTPSYNPISRDEAEAIAKLYFHQIFGEPFDTSGYRIDEVIDALNTWLPHFRIEFVRYKGEIRLKEIISIDIDPNGNIFFFSFSGHGRHDGIDLSFVDMGEIEDVFEKIIEYVNISERKNFSVPEDIWLFKFNDGSLAFSGTIEEELEGSAYQLTIKLILNE